jgi:integrase/recombinase XerC
VATRPAEVPDASTSSQANAALLDAFVTHLAPRPRHTRDAYLRDVRQLVTGAGDTPLAALSRAQVARMLATLHARGLSGRSLSRMLSAWRAFYRFLLDQDRTLSEDPCAGLKAPKSPKRLPSVLTPDEAVRLVAIEGSDRWMLRDRALLELAYSSGLRLSELAGLDVEGVDLATGEVRVWGKGAKERVVPVGGAAREAIGAWLAQRSGLPVADGNALFIGGGGRRMSARTIERRLAQWAVRCGLDRHVHPHMLRHSFASHVLQSSGDLRAVQEMLGHASIASTQVYTHLDFQALAKVYDAAHPRAKRRK